VKGGNREKLKKVMAVDTYLIVSAKTRQLSSRGVMGDWKKDLKRMDESWRHLQDLGQRRKKRERTRGGTAKYHRAVPFSML
jgi:hypothetical protein